MIFLLFLGESIDKTHMLLSDKTLKSIFLDTGPSNIFLKKKGCRLQLKEKEKTVLVGSKMLTGCLVWFIPSQTPTHPLNTKCSPFKNKEPRQTQTDTRIFWRVDAETVRVFWKCWVSFHSQAWTTITLPPWLFLKIETTKLCLHSAPPNHSACVLELKVHFPSRRGFFFCQSHSSHQFSPANKWAGTVATTPLCDLLPRRHQSKQIGTERYRIWVPDRKKYTSCIIKLRVFGRWIKDKWSEKLRTTLLFFIQLVTCSVYSHSEHWLFLSVTVTSYDSQLLRHEHPYTHKWVIINSKFVCVPNEKEDTLWSIMNSCSLRLSTTSNLFLCSSASSVLAGSFLKKGFLNFTFLNIGLDRIQRIWRVCVYVCVYSRAPLLLQSSKCFTKGCYHWKLTGKVQKWINSSSDPNLHSSVVLFFSLPMLLLCREPSQPQWTTLILSIAITETERGDVQAFSTFGLDSSVDRHLCEAAM